MATLDLGRVVGSDGKSATLELTGAESLPYGSVPTVTEVSGSTALARKYKLGIPEGAQGPQGTQGPKGDQGPQGEKGDKGDTGPEGPAGPQGEQGIQGETGSKGDKGDPGEKGDTGATGPVGADGFTPTLTLTRVTGGVQMKVTNRDGEHSQIVYDGQDGNSTGGGTGEDGGYYMPSVNVDGDITWTASKAGMPDLPETNIKGPKGDTGPQGEKGNVGAQGPQGERGPQGEQGPQGEKGDTGDKGDTGAAGPAGSDGKTPVRGTDYWTTADIAEIKSYVDDAILNGAW